jgi:hypothetical protein
MNSNRILMLVVGLIILGAVIWYFVLRKKPTLKVTNSPVSVGGELKYTFSNFQPDQSVGVHVQDGGGVNLTADSNGSGSSLFIDGDPPGDYILVAEDNFNHRATCSFKVK